jgi:hypothetical protein
MRAMTTQSKSKILSSVNLSTWFVGGLTVIALLVGWLIKQGVQNDTKRVERQGVVAMAPAGWMINYGLQSEERVFEAVDPLDLTHRYVVSLLPVAPEGKIVDLVVIRNLKIGQNLNLYRVIDQDAVLVMGRESYKVTYAYVQPNESGMLPQVVQGVDYYLRVGDKALVVTMEEVAGLFKDALPKFLEFLNTVTYIPGG